MYSLLIARPVAQKRHGVFLPTRKFLTNPYVSAAFAHRRQFVVHLAYAFLIASYIPVSADRARDQGLANNRCGIESDEPEATNVAHPPGGAGCRPGIIPETLRLESSINLPRSKVSAFSSILAVARAWVMHIHVNRNDAINESTPISTRTVPYFHIDEVDGDSWIDVDDLIDEDSPLNDAKDARIDIASLSGKRNIIFLVTLRSGCSSIESGNRSRWMDGTGNGDIQKEVLV